MENECKPIFDEELTNVQNNEKKRPGEVKEKISRKSVKDLAKKLISFIEYKYTSSTKDEVRSVCESAVELFTTLGGMVSSDLFLILHNFISKFQSCSL